MVWASISQAWKINTVKSSFTRESPVPSISTITIPYFTIVSFTFSHCKFFSSYSLTNSIYITVDKTRYRISIVNNPNCPNETPARTFHHDCFTFTDSRIGVSNCALFCYWLIRRTDPMRLTKKMTQMYWNISPFSTMNSMSIYTRTDASKMENLFIRSRQTRFLSTNYPDFVRPWKSTPQISQPLLTFLRATAFFIGI